MSGYMSPQQLHHIQAGQWSHGWGEVEPHALSTIHPLSDISSYAGFPSYFSQASPPQPFSSSSSRTSAPGPAQDWILPATPPPVVLDLDQIPCSTSSRIDHYGSEHHAIASFQAYTLRGTSKCKPLGSDRALRQQQSQQPFAPLNTQHYPVPQPARYQPAPAAVPVHTSMRRGSATALYPNAGMAQGMAASPYPTHSSRRPSINGDQHVGGGIGPMRSSRRHSRSRSNVDIENYHSHSQPAKHTVSGPSNYALLPQRQFHGHSEHLRGYTQPSIFFQRVGCSEVGVLVSKLLDTTSQKYPSVVRGEEKVAFIHEKEIRVHLEWPGYASFSRRVKTHNGELTRDTLLIFFAKLMREFMTELTRDKTIVKKKYEAFSICRSDGFPGAISLYQTIITAIHHRGGANWQVEIWIPGL